MVNQQTNYQIILVSFAQLGGTMHCNM